MSNLISQLASSENKTAYQKYTVTHGIEKIEVLVPLAQASVFEQKFKDLPERKKNTILEIVKSVGGKVRG
jgi:hypothetical protein